MHVQARAFSYYQEAGADPRFQTVTSPDAFGSLMQRLDAASIFAADTETSGLAWYRHARACGYAFTTKENGAFQNFYVPIRHLTGEQQLAPEIVVPAIRERLQNPTKTVIWHNKKFDDHICRRDGIELRGQQHDTMILARLYDENQRMALKHRALIDLQDSEAHIYESLLDRETTRLAKAAGMKKRAYKDAFGFSQIPIHMAGSYGGRDTEYTFRLFELYQSLGVIDFYSRSPRGPHAPGIYQTEMELTRILCDMEEDGVLVDVDYLVGLKHRMGAEKHRLEAQIWDAIGHHRKFDLTKDEQLRWFLLNVLQLPLWKRTKKGDKWSVDKEVLDHFATDAPVLKLIREWREAHKIETTYTDSILTRLDANNILHTDFQQVGTDTGRLSCKNPNMQNVASDDDDRAEAYCGMKLEDGGVDPWSVKRGFIIEPGMARLFIDYSQIELRVLAHYSQDPVMMDVYLSGGDIHERTSLEVFKSKEKKHRRPAKVINFGLSYCLSAIGFARQARVPLPEAEAYYAEFDKRFAGIGRLRKSLWDHMRLNRGQFHNMFGRTRRVPRILSPVPRIRGRAERMSIGSLIQGTAAELTKESIVRLDHWKRQEGLEFKMKLTVHDEIQLDTPITELARAASGSKWLMEQYPEFAPIPIIADVEYSVTNWAEKKKCPV